MTATPDHGGAVAREGVTVESCQLDLGELHRLDDPGFYHPELRCVTEDGVTFVARLRLHVTEPLDPLTIADPRMFSDGGRAANSAGSPWLPRRISYDASSPDLERLPSLSPLAALPDDVRLFEIRAEQISEALWRQQRMASDSPVSGPIRRLAVTCHDPQQVGGGNLILFRYINWLADLGVRTTVYSCGAPPTWTRVEACFRQFDSYDDLFAAVEEDALVLFSMWHIEPLLRAPRGPTRVAYLRQIAEPFHYGVDWASMCAQKPVIDLLESLPFEQITVSPHLQHHAAAAGCRPRLIPNGIDLANFFPTVDVERSTELFTLLSVGHPHHFVKGGAVLAEALAVLAGRHPNRRFRWIIAGADPGLSLALPVVPPPTVEIVPRARVSASDMRSLYQSADLFVNPSLYEGFGLPSLEAMACGTPVVHADNQGLDGIVRDRHNCLIVPPNDPQTLADAIERVMEEPVLADRIVAAGLDTAARYSTAQQFEAFVTVFDAFLNSPFAPASVEAVRNALEREQLGTVCAGSPGSPQPPWYQS